MRYQGTVIPTLHKHSERTPELVKSSKSRCMCIPDFWPLQLMRLYIYQDLFLSINNSVVHPGHVLPYWYLTARQTTVALFIQTVFMIIKNKVKKSCNDTLNLSRLFRCVLDTVSGQAEKSIYCMALKIRAFSYLHFLKVTLYNFYDWDMWRLTLMDFNWKLSLNHGFHAIRVTKSYRTFNLY